MYHALFLSHLALARCLGILISASSVDTWLKPGVNKTRGAGLRQSPRRPSAKLRQLLPVFLFVWLSLLWTPPHAAYGQALPAVPKRILSIQDNERTMFGMEAINQAFQSAVRSGPPGSVELYDESLEFYRFRDEHHESLMHDYLKQKYAGIQLDVIVTWMDPTLQFVLRYRDELFPGVPIVYLTARPYTNSLPPNTTGLWGQVALKDTLALA